MQEVMPGDITISLLNVTYEILDIKIDPVQSKSVSGKK